MVIHRYKCMFCKLGTNRLKFHPVRNAWAVAVIRKIGRKIVPQKKIIGQVHYIKYKYLSVQNCNFTPCFAWV